MLWYQWLYSVKTPGPQPASRVSSLGARSRAGLMEPPVLWPRLSPSPTTATPTHSGTSCFVTRRFLAEKIFQCHNITEYSLPAVGDGADAEQEHGGGEELVEHAARPGEVRPGVAGEDARGVRHRPGQVGET